MLARKPLWSTTPPTDPPRRQPRSWRDAAAVLLLGLLALIPFVPMLFGGQTDALGDNRWVILPRVFFFHQQVRQGVFPLWDPSVMAGLPGDAFFMPSSLYYPPFWLSLHAPTPFLAFHLYAFSNLWFCAAAFYAFARVGLRTGVLAGMGGAVVYSLNGWMLSALVANYVPLSGWIPLLLLAALCHLHTRRASWLFALAIFTGLQWSFPGPQFWVFSLIGLGFLWLGWRWLRQPAGAPPATAKTLALHAGALLAGQATALFVLVPFAQQIRGMARSQWAWRWHVPYEWSPFNVAASFFPNLFGSFYTNTHWAGGAYFMDAACFFGLGVVVLLCLAGRDRLGRAGLFFLLVALFGWLMAFGGKTPLGLLVHNLPVLSGFWQPGRYLVFAGLGFAAAVALALQGLQTRPLQRLPRFWTVLFVALGGGCLLGAVVFLGPGRQWLNGAIKTAYDNPVPNLLSRLFLEGKGHNPWSFYEARLVMVQGVVGVSLLASGLTTLAGLGLSKTLAKHPAWLAAAWVALLAVSLLQVKDHLIKWTSQNDYLRQPAYVKWLRRQPHPTLWRYWATNGPYTLDQWPHTGEEDRLWGLNLAGGYVHFHPFLLSGGHHPELDKDCRYFAVRYLSNAVTLKHPTQACAIGRRVASFAPHPKHKTRRPVSLFRVKDPLPVVFLAKSPHFYNTPQVALQTMRRSHRYNPRFSALVSGEAAAAFAPLRFTPQADPGEGVTLTRPTPHEVRLLTRSRHDRVLVLLDTHFPGWRATLDGHTPLPIAQAFGGFKAMPLPKGRHEVRLRYEPVWRARLLPFCLALWGVLVAGWWLSWRGGWRWG